MLEKDSPGFDASVIGRARPIAERLMKPKRTILCVDDNEQSLSHRKIMLETRGYRVASFVRGEEALAALHCKAESIWSSPTWRCPALDGPQLIARIKDLSPHTPAILISSKVRIYDHDSQADVFLTKGMYAPVDLLERVRLLLVRKRGPKRMQQRPSQFPARSARPEVISHTVS
jgi:two-component system response regulator CpxR